MATFFEQLRSAAVSFFAAPPRIWNVLYSVYQAKLLAAQERVRREGLSPAERDMLVQGVDKEIVEVFGPNCSDVSTGGATTSAAVLTWMRRVLNTAGISVYEGYGVTEAGTIAVNGVRVFECSVFLQDVPEMGYLSTSKPPRGLLWVHTSEMAGGYHGDLQNTADNFKDVHGDGRMWFNTGDIVEYDKRLETIRVIDRKKNIIKLAQSCFVAPEYLENVLTAVPLLTAIWIHADSAQEFVLCVVQPNRCLLEHQAREAGVAFDSFEDLCSCPAAQRLVLDAMATMGREQGLQPYEIPRGVILEPRLWTVENGELTTSLKLVRIALQALYGPALARMYVALGGVDTTLLPTVGAPDPTMLTEPVGPGTGSAPGEVFARLLSSVIHCAVAEIDWTQPLVQCGVDSSSLLHLCSLLHAHSLPVPPLHILMKEPLGNVRRAVTGETACSTDVAIKWEAECTLPDALMSAIAKQVPCTPAADSVFLTGASGFVGSFILRDLLQHEQPVICLVRAMDAALGLKRLLDTPALVLAGAETLARARSLITVVLGDAGKERFGMDVAAYSDLVLRTKAVVHAAAHVSGLLTYPLLRDANVQATVACLMLAAAAGARFVYVSSLSALTGLERGCELGVPSLHCLDGMSGYAASKRVSEIVVAKACLAGLRGVCVVRPGTVGPCSDGSLSPHDTITRYLSSIVELGISPSIQAEISLCSVCDVAALVVRLLTGPQTQPPPSAASVVPWCCYNIFGPSTVSTATIAMCAREQGWPVGDAAYSAFVSAVGAGRTACALSPLRGYFDSGFPLGLDRASSDATDEFFATNKMHRHVVDKAAIAQCYRHLVQIGALKVIVK